VTKFIFILSLLSLVFVCNTKAQNTDSLTIYTKSFNLDTSINPDYFEVVIGVTEYLNNPGKRRSKRILIPIDSIKTKLFAELDIFRVKDSVKLANISEFVLGNYYQENKVYYFYTFNYYNIDSIEKLSTFFKRAYQENKNMSFYAAPKTLNSTDERVKKALEKKGQEIIKSDVEGFANKHSLKVGKIKNYNVTWSNYNYNYYQQQYHIVHKVILQKPVLGISLYYQYSLH